MSGRRLVAWAAVFVSAGLALLGFLVFVIALLIEFFGTRGDMLSDVISPGMQLGLAGLCLTAIMVILGFSLVGLLLARQTRRQAPGYGDAYRFIERLQFNQAVPLLERAVETGHITPDVLMLLTSAYAFTGQIAKAQATADQAVQLYPDQAEAYITLANGYRLQASYDEAARALQHATTLAPDQAVVWAELGFVQRLAGDESAAIAAFERSAQLPMPMLYSIRVYYHLAQHYRSQGKMEQANDAMLKMLSAREGLEAWRMMQKAMEGTVYGQALRYEINAIDQAIASAASAAVT